MALGACIAIHKDPKDDLVDQKGLTLTAFLDERSRSRDMKAFKSLHSEKNKSSLAISLLTWRNYSICNIYTNETFSRGGLLVVQRNQAHNLYCFLSLHQGVGAQPTYNTSSCRNRRLEVSILTTQKLTNPNPSQSIEEL